MHLPRYALFWSAPALGICCALAFAWRVLAVDTPHPPLAEFAIAWTTVLASLLAGIAALRSRLTPALACMLQAGALATAGSALGLAAWPLVFRPLAMLCALAAVALHLRRRVPQRGDWLLLAALGASLAGEVLLMLPGVFVPGFAAFVLAQLCYLALFQQGQRWFALRGALLLAGVVVYALMWRGGLRADLRLPIAVYVLAIALMAAQAWGRWHGTPGSGRRAALLVALGASSFVLSDLLLAVHRCVQPLPWAPLGILGSYYLAQALIVTGMLCAARPQASGSAGGVTPR